MRSEVVRRPSLPPAFRNLAYICPEVRTITAVYEVTERHLLADIDGERYRIVATLWGLIRELGGDYTGVQLLPKRVGMHQWRYVPVSPQDADERRDLDI
ncbi:MAG: hypothetical protein EOO77_29830 [Oxalobacteraceae bacterium]|nr:MAG: hypothetical protein EOO77_29830 [Oxalobacteraceae bacterium]